MFNGSTSAQAVATSSVLPVRKRRRCYFSPSDDQKLNACRSREELLTVISALVRESNYSRRNVVNHAKALGVWDRFPIQKAEPVSMVRFLSNPMTQEDPLTVVATKLRITKTAARKRIYRDEDCLECLMGGIYSAREVAEGLCLRRSTLSALIQSGCLRAKQLQRPGKWRISSEAVAEFVLAYPRQISWSRCLEKSSWLRDILEAVRYQQAAAILGVSLKTLRSWIERNILQLKFDSQNISAFFSDEPLYRMLDEYPELINLPQCVAAHPEWFQRYEDVRGQYPKRPLPSDKSKTSDPSSATSFRILLRR